MWLVVQKDEAGNRRKTPATQQRACYEPTEVAEKFHQHHETVEFVDQWHQTRNVEILLQEASALVTAESLPAGSDQPWFCLRSVKRLYTGVGLAKTTVRRRGYIDETQSMKCDCREDETMSHLLCYTPGRTVHAERSGHCH